MIAIMRGMEVGLTPFMALDKIAIVNGRPTIWGDGAIGLVRGSGLCEFIKERIEGSGDARMAVCEAKRRGEPEPIRRTFSVADAKKAGLWGKQGPWQQYPERMLQMRARAFALRDGFADVLGGLYLREEIEDAQPMRDITPREEPPAPPSAAQISPKADDPPAPEAPEEVAADDGDDMVAFITAKLMEAQSVEALNEVWDKHVTPIERDLFPHDQENLMSIFRKREAELA
ncbi:recombinase RecT [Bradyrhizobium japonicum]|uniref:recombinase RecT n=1 Tax=Bradyrhizobium japonicum TaxID=375 RepID=UPI001FD9F6DC|nr:recombinase RecT [Bradyrhizobium japonicum]